MVWRLHKLIMPRLVLKVSDYMNLPSLINVPTEWFWINEITISTRRRIKYSIVSNKVDVMNPCSELNMCLSDSVSIDFISDFSIVHQILSSALLIAVEHKKLCTERFSKLLLVLSISLSCIICDPTEEKWFLSFCVWCWFTLISYTRCPLRSSVSDVKRKL